MIGWIILGAIGLYAVSKKQQEPIAPSTPPAPAVHQGTIVQAAPAPVSVPMLNTSAPPTSAPPVFINAVPLPVQRMVPIPSPEPIVTAPIFDPKFVPAPQTVQAIDNSVGATAARNLQIAVASDKAMGSFTGYGVPLSGSGMFTALDDTQINSFFSPMIDEAQAQEVNLGNSLGVGTGGFGP